MSRVLLIEPPTPSSNTKVMRIIGSLGSLKAKVIYPPHDLTILGGLLEDHGIDFKIIDALNLNYTWAQLEKVIEFEQPEAVVFTVTTQTFDNDAITSKIAKNVDIDIRTIAINLLMQTCTYDILQRFPHLDFAVVKDYEQPVIDLIENGYNPECVDGIFYRDKKGKTIKNPCTPRCHNFGSIPAHGKLPIWIYQDHLIRKRPMTIVLCSKGCINQCHHCTTKYLNPLRIRPVDSVVQELKYIQDLGINEVEFWDSELPFERNNTKQKWMNEFLDKIKKEGITLSMICNARSDCVNYNILKKMKEVGFHTIRLGADSNSQKILDNMNKNETVEEIEQAVENIKKHDLTLLTYCTFGHRGETRETMYSTINWIINKLKPDYSTFTLAVPLYGTVFYNYLKEHGYLQGKTDGDPNTIPTFSYEGRFEKEGIPDLKKEEMYHIAMDGYRRFYNLRFTIKRLFKTKNISWDIENFIYFIQRYYIEPFYNNLIKKNRA